MEISLFRLSRRLFYTRQTKPLIYAVNIVMPEEEAKEMGLEYEDGVVNVDYRVGNFYRTENGYVCNLKHIGDGRAYFPQFTVDIRVKKPSRAYYASDKDKRINKFKVLFGGGLNKTKLAFYWLYYNSDSPFFMDGKKCLLELFREEIEKGIISKYDIHNKLVRLILSQEWVKKLNLSPFKDLVMSSLKKSLEEMEVDYNRIIGNYIRIAEQDDDKKAALLANKELERMIEKSEEEEIKRLKAETIRNLGATEEAKMLNGGTVEPFNPDKFIMEAAEELEEGGDDYVNQNMEVDEES